MSTGPERSGLVVAGPDGPRTERLLARLRQEYAAPYGRDTVGQEVSGHRMGDLAPPGGGTVPLARAGSSRTTASTSWA